MDFPLMTFVSTTPAPAKSTDELILELQGADREYRSLRAIADRGGACDQQKLDTLAGRVRGLSETLYEMHKGLIGSAVRSFHSWSVDRDDLWQLGRKGFFQGLLGYDPRTGFALSSYVTRCIVNAALEGIRNDDGHLSSRTFKQHKAKINGVICQLLGRGQTATIEAIYRFMRENLPEEERLSLFQIKKILTPGAVLPADWVRIDPNDIPDSIIKHCKENDGLAGYTFGLPAGSNSDPVSNAIVNEMESQIRRILTSDDDYMLFMTWYRSDENVAETADIREMDEDTVRSEIKRIRKILRREMASYNPLAA
ncbi:MAG: hypothetical protein IKF77_06010 [Thermoguttaceae bacterium]|nr:hypothetical protein [Thermoguttaceae bacterium]